MECAIIFSAIDNASMNIMRQLRFYKPEFKCYTINKDTVYAENLDRDIDADILIFATRHESKARKPSLLIHSPGNFAKAELGGRDRQLCTAYPSLLKSMFINLNRIGKSLSNFDITLEATHHGPYLKKPCMFIEIGSTPEEWSNEKAGKIIAETIIESLGKIEKKPAAIGLGGPHYCPNFNKIMLQTEYALGHICPKYSLQHLDKNMLDQMIDRSIEHIEVALLDWKGLGQEKKRILGILENYELQVKKI
ncbi:hypothetical protein JW930_07050 [Candidatus Woesearchaeota archaeon]|nr:hypothetical protein [Candidatus Woesearchaeota archaeon]